MTAAVAEETETGTTGIITKNQNEIVILDRMRILSVGMRAGEALLMRGGRNEDDF